MDLSHWNIIRTFTLWEAACLAAGVDPNLEQLTPDHKARATLLHRELAKEYELAVGCAATVLDEPDCDESVESIFMFDSLPSIQLIREVERCLSTQREFDRQKFLNEHEQKFPREQLQEWFEYKGFRPAYTFVEPREQKTEKTKEPRMTLHANTSEKLSRMIQASSMFWANADRKDRGTHPDNAVIASWLEKHGFTATLAAKAATIIRPEWAPTGRKPEE